MIVLIDNYDSFTYNLVQYFGQCGADVRVFRNDAIDVVGIRRLEPDHIVVSPGPCTPKEAGISCDVIRALGPRIPTLGVCLGHQCIGDVFGGDVVRADRIMHGKVSAIRHHGNVLFQGIESPFTATRYHSLIIKRETCPDVLQITAETDIGEIMGVAHREYPIWGVQFHPESFLTPCGMRIIENFLDAAAGHARRATPTIKAKGPDS
ncbi:MAG TPA: aminodeoxychorismate/anthranilate synthase component II [Candidatus Hydrogenedentes bacterium]|nr:aminodeoxychorismate/anthranilate synthase component II [Candidatus Hydrogenedentota bacterium]HPG66798.1 aminodeoxychorismate/anthranilate synthase component II [Candidatus Hydrogenedentota bacterium]